VVEPIWYRGADHVVAVARFAVEADFDLPLHHAATTGHDLRSATPAANLAARTQGGGMSLEGPKVRAAPDMAGADFLCAILIGLLRGVWTYFVAPTQATMIGMRFSTDIEAQG